MGWIGGQELLLIFVVILLVFGPRKIPEVARGLGKGLREFRRLTTDFQREINLAESEPPPKPRPEIASGAPASVETAAPETSRSEVPPAGAISRSAEAPGPDSPSPGAAEPKNP